MRCSSPNVPGDRATPRSPVVRIRRRGGRDVDLRGRRRVSLDPGAGRGARRGLAGRDGRVAAHPRARVAADRRARCRGRADRRVADSPARGIAKLARSDRDGVSGTRSQLDTYMLRRAGEETWEPRYSYEGFQYVQVDGYPGTPGPDDVQARRIHSAVRTTGTFSADNPVLETIHAAVVSTTLNNNVSVPTDGSMVEKLPWTGDAGLMSDSSFTNFDMRRLYTKWLVDIEHSQDASGNIGSWAPQPPGELRAPSAAWGDQYLQTAWNLYVYYGDAVPMRAHYASMKRYFAFEVGRLDACGI